MKEELPAKFTETAKEGEIELTFCEMFRTDGEPDQPTISGPFEC
ncbi:hypothetical protein OAE01_00385 [Akkermansiaceae bacterium]|nr:hypothetical protein [bacterium]MDB4625641.1 hypothetical protein [Akkermansiaceae bacterium]